MVTRRSPEVCASFVYIVFVHFSLSLSKWGEEEETVIAFRINPCDHNTAGHEQIFGTTTTTW